MSRKRTLLAGLAIAGLVFLGILSYRDITQGVHMTLIIPAPVDAPTQESRVYYYQWVHSLFGEQGFSTTFSNVRYDSQGSLEGILSSLRSSAAVHLVVIYHDDPEGIMDQIQQHSPNTLLIFPTHSGAQRLTQGMESIGIAPTQNWLIEAIRRFVQHDSRILWISSTAPDPKDLPLDMEIQWLEWNQEMYLPGRLDLDQMQYLAAVVSEFKPDRVYMDVSHEQAIQMIEWLDQMPRNQIIFSPGATQFFMISDLMEELRGVVGMSWIHPDKAPSLTSRWDAFPAMDVIHVFSDFFAKARKVEGFSDHLHSARFSGPFSEVVYTDGHRVPSLFFLELGTGMLEPLYTVLPSR